MHYSLTGRALKDQLVFHLGAAKIGCTPERVWCPVPSPAHRTRPYAVPKTVLIGTRDTAEAGARFSPSPYAVIVEGRRGRVFIGVSADPGWHLWNYVSFEATREGVVVRVDLEGHSSPSKAAQHIRLNLVPAEAGEERYAHLRRALAALYPVAAPARAHAIPAWWRRPIYCGWGDQVAMSLAMEGPGLETRALAYCIQGLYERWIRRLEQAGVPFGTVIIDAGWALGGVWKPHPPQWPDLKGFIARQHAQGRHVLLWIPAWYQEGLPDKWCIFSGRQKLVADPTNPSYRRFLENQVGALLSSGGYDADGFKVDMLGNVPSERKSWSAEHFGRRTPLASPHPRIRLKGRTWGCELLYELQKTIYCAAKAVKPDALITSSTVHPYFHDSFDMVRLHDTGVVKGSVMAAMKARADLAKAALPGHLIDTDDWIAYDFARWLDYTINSRKLGVPCIFYAERFVRSFDREPVAPPLSISVLRRIARAWRNPVPA